jgi:hypothetical protein
MSTDLRFSGPDVEHTLSRSASRAQELLNPSCNTNITYVFKAYNEVEYEPPKRELSTFKIVHRVEVAAA